MSVFLCQFDNFSRLLLLYKLGSINMHNVFKKSSDNIDKENTKNVPNRLRFRVSLHATCHCRRSQAWTCEGARRIGAASMKLLILRRDGTINAFRFSLALFLAILATKMINNYAILNVCNGRWRSDLKQSAYLRREV